MHLQFKMIHFVSNGLQAVTERLSALKRPWLKNWQSVDIDSCQQWPRRFVSFGLSWFLFNISFRYYAQFNSLLDMQ